MRRIAFLLAVAVAASAPTAVLAKGKAKPKAKPAPVAAPANLNEPGFRLVSNGFRAFLFTPFESTVALASKK